MRSGRGRLGTRLVHASAPSRHARLCFRTQSSEVPPPSYPSLLTWVSSRRRPSAIRSLQPLLKTPGMLSLGGGMPAPHLFPFQRLTVEVTSPLAPLGPPQTMVLEGDRLKEALQYSPSWGLDRLLLELKALQGREHGEKVAGNPIMVTTGSQEGLTKAFEMLVERDTPILVESPTYSGALAALRPLGARLVAVPLDQEGPRPDSLEQALRTQAAQGTPVRLFYTIPTGQNPSGVTTSERRRREIYALCERHDVLILEDDPYWFLQFDPAVRARLPSYARLDRSGRVLRFDSLSKVLSAGMRLGWVSGPRPLLERLELHQQASTLHASGLSQALVALVLQTWGPEGWSSHVARVARYYAAQGQAASQAAQEHLGGWAEWRTPEAGMFLWLKLRGVEDTRRLIEQDAVAAKVLLVPGAAFDPEEGLEGGARSSWVRAAFSTSTPEQMREAFRRLALLLAQRSGPPS